MALRLVLGLSILIPGPLLFWLTDHYAKTCPAEPDEQAGATYRLNDHGSVVYLTMSQRRNMLAGQAFLVVSILCFVALEVWTSREQPSKKTSSLGGRA